MTNTPPSESPSDKQCVSFSVATKYGAWNCNNNDEEVVVIIAPCCCYREWNSLTTHWVLLFFNVAFMTSSCQIWAKLLVRALMVLQFPKQTLFFQKKLLVFVSLFFCFPSKLQNRLTKTNNFFGKKSFCFGNCSTDGVFQYPWGEMSWCQKKSRNPIATQKRFMTTEVMSGIWSNHVDSSLSVGLSHWMDSAYLLTVIVYMYKIPQLVLYNNSGIHTKHIDGSMCFNTSVYCYDDSQCRVSTKSRSGLEHDIVACGNACIVFFVSNLITCYLSIMSLLCLLNLIFMQ